MKRFTMMILSLTTFLVGLIWIVGSGEAVSHPDNPIIVADTVHINLGETQYDSSEIVPAESRETLFREIKKFNQTVYDIKNRYMEDIDTRKLINAGIKGMLENLDRYSVLMEKQSYDQLMESTHGKYEGLGMEIDSRNDHITVVTPMEGTPAYKRGLRPGDEIYEIAGKSTYKMSTSDASKLMRGPSGTTVTLKIKREGSADLLDFEIERAVIELKSVNYYGVMPGSNVGYIRLSRFAEETSHELEQAVNDLNAKGVSGLIFDLRSNGGGLLQQAVETSELFIPEGKLVVYTRGKFADTERRYYSRRLPIYPDKPLVVLVDEGTASASEIVAGALQDWDRGIIVGHPTYGKGLVQQIFPVGNDDDVALKLTIAKYYVPSGRCIQKPEKEMKHPDVDMASAEGDDENVPDSLKSDSLVLSKKEVYYTNNGRTVYGGGGILPDLETEPEKYLTTLEINLERKRLFFDFAVKYLSSNSNAVPGMEISDDIVKQFHSFIESKNFTYKTSLESSMDKMKEIIKDEKKDELFSSTVAEFEGRIKQEKVADFEASKDYIKRAIKREIVQQLAGERGLYEEVILKTDPGIKKAAEILGNDAEYSRLLTSGQTRGQKPEKE
jgi:carboxyl-terminal processing protease